MPQQLKRGVLISIEGIDGSGKSTLSKNLFAVFTQNAYDVVLTREPGGTPFGLQVRQLIIQRDLPHCPKAQYLLFAADRAQHFEEVVMPAIRTNKIVISDRLSDSSLAYQCYGNGLSIDMVQQINQWTMSNIKPDITIYVRVPLEIALERVMQRNAEITSFEKKEFLEKVLNGFETVYKNRTDVIQIDGTQSSKIVTEKAFIGLEKWLQNNALL